MADWISKHDWQNELQQSGTRKNLKNPDPHERFKYRALTWVETNLLNGRQIGEFKNFTIIRKFK